MWDDVQALRKVTHALLGASLLLALFGALHYAVHLPVFGLRVVRLDSAPRRVDIGRVEAIVRNDLRGNFFTVDLEQISRAFEQLPWVRTVSVQRRFPWQLDVHIEEQTMLASWNGAQFVNPQGEIFSADAEPDKALPGFDGPGGAAGEMTQQYARFSEMLAPLHQQIGQLSLSPRHAWQLRLRNGMILKLGREKIEERLARFIAVYPASVATMRQPSYVDLRYRNGFAAG